MKWALAKVTGMPMWEQEFCSSCAIYWWQVIPDMQQYEIVLKNEKEKTYRIIGWLLVSVNFISILLLTSAYDFKKWIPFVLACLAIIIIVLLKYLKPQMVKSCLFILLSSYSALAGLSQITGG